MSQRELKVKTYKLSATREDMDDQVTIGLRFKTDFRDQFLSEVKINQSDLELL